MTLAPVTHVDADVAIIGAGYTGLSCALYLAKEHGIRARVLEANRPGWGCSGRNGGFARAAIGRTLRDRVDERHSVDSWADRILEVALR